VLQKEDNDWMLQPVMMTFTDQSLHRIDMEAFCQNILQFRLFGKLEMDADGCADLFDAKVKRVLDIHAPQRTGRHCGQHDRCHLLDEVRQANLSNVVSNFNVGTAELACSQTCRPMFRLLQRHARVSSCHKLIT